MTLATRPRTAVAAALSLEVLCFTGAALRVLVAADRFGAVGAVFLVAFFFATFFLAAVLAVLFGTVFRAVCLRVVFFAKLTSAGIHARPMPAEVFASTSAFRLVFASA